MPHKDHFQNKLINVNHVMRRPKHQWTTHEPIDSNKKPQPRRDTSVRQEKEAALLEQVVDAQQHDN